MELVDELRVLCIVFGAWVVSPRRRQLGWPPVDIHHKAERPKVPLKDTWAILINEASALTARHSSVEAEPEAGAGQGREGVAGEALPMLEPPATSQADPPLPSSWAGSRASTRFGVPA